MTRKVVPQLIYLLIFVFSLCQIGAAQNSTSAQSQSLTDDLNRKFKDFDLVKINPQNARSNVLANGNLELRVGAESLPLRLTPRNLLSANYRAEETGANGTNRISAPPIRTFKGTVSGEEHSRVRLTISDKEIEGLIVRGTEFYFIEPAKHFSQKAANEDFVVYRKQDLMQHSSLSCDLPHRFEEAAERYLPQREQRENPVSTFLETEIATEADFQFVTELGGVAAANAEILDVLNVVEGVYQNELGITFSVTFQHAWSIPDPYPTGNTESVLQSFRSYWNANFPPSSYPRDAAHLFSSKEAIKGMGRAFLGVICRPDVAYGIHGRFPYGNGRFSLFAHELGHNFNAGHSDGSPSCADTLMNAMLSTLTPLSFCPASRSEMSNYVSGNNSCLPLRTLTKAKFDYDGDRKADNSVFRRLTGDWYFLQSKFNNLRGVRFGVNGDVPLAEDFDGDGIFDTVVYRGGAWYIMRSTNDSFNALNFGLNSDIPVPADFNGDGRAEIAVFRPLNGTWYWLDLTNNNFNALQFGTREDIPTPEDFDGDGRADISVFRPSTGSWYRLNSQTGQFVGINFGTSGDRPVQADYDGDGKADVAVFRPNAAAWYILRSSDGGMTSASFGAASDVPVPADYDGDGRADIAVFRAGIWYRLNSSTGAFGAMQFGGEGDIPIPGK